MQTFSKVNNVHRQQSLSYMYMYFSDPVTVNWHIYETELFLNTFGRKFCNTKTLKDHS